VGSPNGDPAADPGPDQDRYVLLTECLQNDFFLNRECPIFLGDQSALAVLTARTERPVPERTDGRLQIAPKVLGRGPLTVFLDAVVGARRNGSGCRGTLHVVNIRDWHEPGPVYDLERRKYGSHCEKGTWGARYVTGLERFLDPAAGPSDQEAIPFVQGSVRVCHVHSDSVFDFRPREGGARHAAGKLPRSELEDLLDILIQGNEKHAEALDVVLGRAAALIQGQAVQDAEFSRVLRLVDPRREDGPAGFRRALEEGRGRDAVQELITGLSKLVDRDPDATPPRVYVAVVGAYSDVKILTLLGGLRARYDLPNLALADSLSASPTLERHISGLDFAHKVMDVEVIHGVNDVVTYLGGTAPIKDESSVVEPNGFARYQTFFKDKQNVLAYQTEQLQEYLALTEKRSLNTYTWIERSNLFLILCGASFLVATLVFAIWSAFDPSVSWKLPAITGGLGLLQLVTVFFRQPMQDLTRNLGNLMTYRMLLESHSLKMALARFHLTTPHTLRDLRTDEVARAVGQVDVLRHQLDVIAAADTVDFMRFANLGFDGNGAGTDANGAAANGGAASGAAANGGATTPSASPPAEEPAPAAAAGPAAAADEVSDH
jgi:hypothetical protein